ncbi:hypothetical protein CABS01_16551, partial [Colletotrichum abscissum]|uniref:uncharacterized protein n=1 Tax=Colletotrichum abscissum TaxID=1671311 RepID=UPI0027D50419
LTPSWSWAKIRSPITWPDHHELNWNEDILQVVSCVEGRQLVVKGHVLHALWDGRVMVLAMSRDNLDRASRAARILAARSRSRSSSGIHQIEVVWDEPSRLKRQRVRCLEIRSSVEGLRQSYGIVLTWDGSTTSRRLGYFKFLHEEVNRNWLRQKRRRQISII